MAVSLLAGGCKQAEPLPDACVGLSNVGCPGYGSIKVQFLVEECPEQGECNRRPLETSRFIEMVELSGEPDDRCGPEDCGAVPHALEHQGWKSGTWRMIPPPIGDLRPPRPFTIELGDQEVEEVTLVYRET